MSELSDGPRYLAWVRNGAWVAVILIAVAALGYSYYARTSAKGNAPQIGGTFALTDQLGHGVSDRDLTGKVLVIYFGFTHCPDACPTTLQAVGAALSRLSPSTRAQIKPVFITLDPERDTPEIMGEYVKGFIPGGVGLTGSPAAIAAIARKYRIGYQKIKDPKSALPYTIDHASIVYIMDRNGHFVRFYPPGFTPDELAKSLKEAVAAP